MTRPRPDYEPPPEVLVDMECGHYDGTPAYALPNGYAFRMFQPGDGARFADEPFAKFRFMHKFPRQDFQSHRTLEAGIIRFEDGGHTAAA